MASLKAYYGITISLTDANPHNLLALLIGVDGSFGNLIQNVGTLSIQADDNNGTSAVLVGDDTVSSTNFGVRLLPHDQTPYRKEAMNIPVGAMYVIAPAATGGSPVVMHVEVIP